MTNKNKQLVCRKDIYDKNSFMENIKKLIKEIYIPTLIKEKTKRNKRESKMTSFIIIEGLELIHFYYKKHEMIKYIKEINLLNLFNEMMKLYENEIEYSDEDLFTIKGIFELLKKYEICKIFYENKNSFLKIITIGMNIINENRNLISMSLIVNNLGKFYKIIPKEENMIILKNEIYKTIIEYVIEKRKMVNEEYFDMCIYSLNILLCEWRKEEKEIKESFKIEIPKYEVDLLTTMKKETESNGIEDFLIENICIKNSYFVKSCIEYLHITQFKEEQN